MLCNDTSSSLLLGKSYNTEMERCCLTKASYSHQTSGIDLSKPHTYPCTVFESFK
jgi:hypothetical protein